jgi:hypothetical protein
MHVLTLSGRMPWHFRQYDALSIESGFDCQHFSTFSRHGGAQLSTRLHSRMGHDNTKPGRGPVWGHISRSHTTRRNTGWNALPCAAAACKGPE